jgi:cell fate regulator YaaT (PSP1 superfamily)
MAKEQNLSLNPTKISGICGRLMCCLKYEQDAYESIRMLLPKVGSIVNTPDGQGEVVENSVVKEAVKVKITIGDGDEEIRLYPIKEVQIIKGGTEAEISDDNIEIEQDENVTPEEIKNILKES